jgi:glycosyltransferase involved in cell wall biosynthesis
MLLCHHRLIVGIPTYNEGRFLSQTLTSLASQTDADFSVLIADNASTDNTRDIGLQFQQADPRFHFVQHDINKGALFNVDFLVKNTESPFFMWFGGHDVLDPDYIKTQLALLEQRGDASLVFSRVQWIDENGAPLRTTDGGNFLIGGTDPLHRFINVANGRWGECTAINSIIRRDALRTLPLLPIEGADHLLLRGLQFHGPFYRTERALYFRREISNRSTSYRERITGAKPDRDATRRDHLPVVWQQLMLYSQLDISLARRLAHLPRFLYALHKEYKFPKLLRRSLARRVGRIF